MVDKKSGFNIDPYHGSQAAETMADFFEESTKNPERWLQVSQGSLARVQEKRAPLSSSLIIFSCAASIGEAPFERLQIRCELNFLGIQVNC